MVVKMKKIVNEKTKPERKTVERNRRIHMKGLCFKLASIIPHKNSKEMLTQQDQFDLAASYITKLKERVESLKSKKELVKKSLKENNKNNKNDFENNGMKLPIMELRDLGNSIEVILVIGLNKKLMLSQVIRILEEEGGEVVSASSFIVEDKVFHTIHAQVKISRVGIETTSVRKRLQQLIS